MTEEKLKIIIADDHTLFIDGLCLLLQHEVNIQILAIAANGRELMGLLHTHTPDIILADINMPGFNGFEALSRIKSFYPKIKVIMLSTYNEEHLIEKAKAGGAKKFPTAAEIEAQIETRGNRRGVGQIQRMDADFAMFGQFSRSHLKCRRVDIPQRYGCARLQQAQTGGEADAAGAARDNRTTSG